MIGPSNVVQLINSGFCGTELQQMFQKWIYFGFMIKRYLLAPHLKSYFLDAHCQKNEHQILCNPLYPRISSAMHYAASPLEKCQ